MVDARSGVLASACLACLATTAVVADDPHVWLERMERALASRNYEGTFVHEHDGQTETLRIVHRVSDGEMVERIVSLDGSGREFIRRDGDLRTYFPDQHVVLVETGPKEGLLLAELQRLDDAAAQLYRLSEEPQTRISGRTAHVIAVEPLDDLRYGFRVWIDEGSAMPLKTQLRSAAGRILEQLVFTELTLPQHISDAALQPAVDARNFRWVHYDAAVAVVSGTAPDLSWQEEQLPAGFRMTANSTQVLPGASTPVTHLVFSDGLASVSVFVEPLPQRAAPSGLAPGGNATTMTSVGSSAALSTVVAGHKVTAIGEVPAATVQAIARSLRATERHEFDRAGFGAAGRGDAAERSSGARGERGGRRSGSRRP